ncbi:hypothetical protein pb186bvf_015891 [Paramecium bursaria]
MKIITIISQYSLQIFIILYHLLGFLKLVNYLILQKQSIEMMIKIKQQCDYQTISPHLTLYFHRRIWSYLRKKMRKY